MPDGPLPDRTELRLLEFVTDTIETFDEAVARGDATVTDHLSLAGRSLRIRYLGPDLAERFGPALAHLRRAGGDATGLGPTDDRPDLELCCWDRSQATVRAPAPPWPLNDFLPHGRIRGMVDGRIRATFDAGSRMLCLHDAERDVAVVHAAEAATVPSWMDRAPFRTVLGWWAADRGMAMLHASAVGTADGAVVLAGTSGAGKSTTALRCLAAGLDFLGDDACVISCAPDPVVHSVYGFVKVNEPVDLPLPRALPWITDGCVFDPADRLRLRAPLRAILLPRIVERTSSALVPMGPSEVLRILGPTSLTESGTATGNALRSIIDLVRCVPAHRLELGSDPAGIVDTVIEAIERAS